MALWLRSGPVGAAEIKDEIREQKFRPGPKWSYVSPQRMKQIEATKAIQRAKAQYAPGGGFGVGVEAGLERGRVKATALGMQHLVGAGLAGTTMAGTLGKKYEEEVAAPTRLGVEEQRAQAISGIEMQQASMAQQAGQAGAQMQFQAGQAGAQRDLQRYIADLQATLQRESMVSRGPTMTASTTPTGGGYAQQFPSIYGQTGRAAPSLGGDEGSRYANSTIGQPIIGGPQAGGMYLGGGRMLSPEQVEWK